jgi:uncharacterized protein (DUF1499 family)
MLKWLLITPVALGVLLVLAGQAGLLSGQAPSNLGLRDGKLKPPSKTPNSVSSQTDLWPEHEQAAYARIAPLALVGTGADRGEATMARLQTVVAAMPGAQVVKAEPGYLYATFTTKLLKFTDDVEFWLDPAAGVVQVRSASRLGRKDFGVNRARVEAIRQQLAGG